MARYNLTKKADADLSQLYAYSIENFGQAQADKYYDELIHQIESIAERPHAWRQLKRFSPAVRICPCRFHIIIYRVQENGVVEIIRIHPARTNWQALYELFQVTDSQNQT